MGERGPIPKRSSERRRRNKPDGPVDSIDISGAVEVPELGMDVHPLAADLYASLADSGEARFYEPSDWEYARMTAYVTSKLLDSSRISAQLLAAVDGMWARLLVAEGDRRRVHLEVERNSTVEGPSAAKVARMDAYRRAAAQS